MDWEAYLATLVGVVFLILLRAWDNHRLWKELDKTVKDVEAIKNQTVGFELCNERRESCRGGFHDHFKTVERSIEALTATVGKTNDLLIEVLRNGKGGVST